MGLAAAPRMFDWRPRLTSLWHHLRLDGLFRPSLDDVRLTMAIPRKASGAMRKEERLSPDAFRKLIVERGWNYVLLSTRWGVRRDYLSRVGRNPERNPYWDDAARGLPHRVQE